MLFTVLEPFRLVLPSPVLSHEKGQQPKQSKPLQQLVRSLPPPRPASHQRTSSKPSLMLKDKLDPADQMSDHREPQNCWTQTPFNHAAPSPSPSADLSGWDCLCWITRFPSGTLISILHAGLELSGGTFVARSHSRGSRLHARSIQNAEAWT